MQSYITPVSYRQLADAYGCSTYGSGTYQNDPQCVTTTAPNTGYAPAEKTGLSGNESILSAVVGGVLILLAVAIVVVWRLKQRKS